MMEVGSGMGEGIARPVALLRVLTLWCGWTIAKKERLHVRSFGYKLKFLV